MSWGMAVTRAPERARRDDARARGDSPRHRPRHRATRTADVRRRAAWAAALAGATVVTLAVTVGPEVVDASGPASAGAPAAADARVAAGAASVTCWNGATVAVARDCTTPHGRSGLASVFPGLTAACQAGPAPRRGVVEVYLCEGSGYRVRYSRWTPGFDRFGVLDHSFGTMGGRWSVDDRFAGRTWTTADRWAATYRARPLSIEVVARDAAARAAAVAAVRVADPARLGR